MCASFCTLQRAVDVLKSLTEEYDITPIMSETTYNTDTRFGTADSFITQVETICKQPILHTISEVEPIGPKALLDVLIIAPCTGNTLSKISAGITDSAVTMAAKAHLRNGRPLVISISTNDGLSGCASNIGKLLSRKHVFFVPFGQDDPIKKPTSIVANLDLIGPCVEAAMENLQLQPILI